MIHFFDGEGDNEDDTVGEEPAMDIDQDDEGEGDEA